MLTGVLSLTNMLIYRGKVLATLLGKIIALKNHQGLWRYMANTSWLLAEQVLRIIASLLVGIWVARYLGPEQYGVFNYVLAFTAIFVGFAKLGLDDILVRELVSKPEQRDVFLGTAFWLKVMGAFLVMILVACIVPFTSNDATTNLYIFIIISGLVFQSFEVVGFYFQSQVLAKVVSLCKVIQLLLSSIIKVYLVVTKAELFRFVCVSSFDMFSLAVSYYVAYLTRGNASFFKCFNVEVAKKLLKNSWPLILSSLVVTIYMRIDQIMIKEMLGEYEVGIYAAAVRLSEAFYFIPVLLTSSLFPAILNAKKESKKLYQKRIQRLYAFLVWMAIIIALIMTLLSDWLVTLLYGKEYLPAGKVLVIHVWASVFVFIGVAFYKYLMAENLIKIDFQRTLAGAVANVGLNLILIPKYGLVGAAVATLVAQFIANYMYDFFDKRLHAQLFLKTQAVFLPFRAFK
ncbi:O-unit flippase [Advenella faeciporci]|uniref:O-unit flippase n=1 Tax=Advenella faeciporci TaxID=797535 RepID=A0A918JRZ8_9BURK|nr:O-unit flippase [Advenella faeciporci]